MKKIFLLLMSIMLICTTVSAAGINSAPVIILKCDDYKSNNLDYIENFDRVFQILQEENVTASFGITGRSASQMNQQKFWDNTKKYIECGIEIWSHGWLHNKNDEGVAEFAGALDYNGMKTNFQMVLDLVKEKTGGYEITTFGPPYNQTNEEFVDKLLPKEFPQIKTIFFSSKGTNSEIVRLNNSMAIEGGGISLEKFKTEYKPDLDYAVLQAHPGSYDDVKMGEYHKIIKFLKEKGCIFMTPSQYTNYLKDIKDYRANAEERMAVLCHNKILDFDVYPYVENGRTFVPIRTISENLSAFVTWNEKTQVVKIFGDDFTLKLKVGSNVVEIDDKEVTIEAPVRIVDGRTMVPLRFIAEAFNEEVLWDDVLNMAIIR